MVINNGLFTRIYPNLHMYPDWIYIPPPISLSVFQSLWMGCEGFPKCYLLTFSYVFPQSKCNVTLFLLDPGSEAFMKIFKPAPFYHVARATSLKMCHDVSHMDKRGKMAIILTRSTDYQVENLIHLLLCGITSSIQQFIPCRTERILKENIGSAELK